MNAGKKNKKFDIPVSEDILSLVPYSPGKPIEELERELGITAIKLASNENPLGPSMVALEALKGAIQNLHRYPDGSCFYLKKRLSSFLGVPEDMLITGNGSNEIIELLVRTFIRKGDEAVMGDPSFAVYPLAVQSAGGTSVKVPLKNFTIDMEKIAASLTERTRLVFISNPNNPTGTIVGKDAVEALIKKLPKGALLCMDEAYFEFVNNASYPDSIKYVKQGFPVVALRTFSKIYGLAGLRVGYGVAPPELAEYMNRVRQPFNVNSLAQAAATAALDDISHVEKSKKNNAEGLKYLYNELEKLGMDYVPAEANFFLIKAGDGQVLYEGLLSKGVIVRPMKSYAMPRYIRVTVGTPEENSRFISALKEVLAEKAIKA